MTSQVPVFFFSFFPNISKGVRVDIIAGIASSASVSPFITIIDQAIFSNASGKESLLHSIKSSSKKLLLNPTQFFKSPQFLWIWFVYSGTYVVANTAQTIAIKLDKDPKIPQFVASSVANISLSSVKDGYFTRMFGTLKPHKVGLGTYSCYAIRDSSTVFASFILPKHIAGGLKQQVFGDQQSTVLAQLFSPCLMQFASTPLHLYGIDLYNNPTNSAEKRVLFIKKEYLKTVSARIGRIFPAFGIGGVTNNYLRS